MAAHALPDEKLFLSGDRLQEMNLPDVEDFYVDWMDYYNLEYTVLGEDFDEVGDEDDEVSLSSRMNRIPQTNAVDPREVEEKKRKEQET